MNEPRGAFEDATQRQKKRQTFEEDMNNIKTESADSSIVKQPKLMNMPEPDDESFTDTEKEESNPV